jgi:hypothetical protein
MYCIINFICVSKYTVNSHNINKLIYRAGVHPDRPPRVEPKMTAMLLQDIIQSHTTIMSRKGHGTTDTVVTSQY